MICLRSPPLVYARWLLRILYDIERGTYACEDYALLSDQLLQPWNRIRTDVFRQSADMQWTSQFSQTRLIGGDTAHARWQLATTSFGTTTSRRDARRKVTARLLFDRNKRMLFNGDGYAPARSYKPDRRSISTFSIRIWVYSVRCSRRPHSGLNRL